MGSFSNSPRQANDEVSAENREALRLLTVADVADILNISRSKIYQLVATGDLAAHRLPAIRVSQKDLQEFLAAHRTNKSSGAESKIRAVKLKHLH